jgi:hypothetical protein
MKNKKKLDFYTSTKSISRNKYVMKEKKGIVNKYQIFFDPKGGNVAGRNSKSI